MPITYSDAPEVEEIANKLIDDHHEHLQDASIKYFFRSGSWDKAGQARKCNSLEHHNNGGFDAFRQKRRGLSGL